MGENVARAVLAVTSDECAAPKFCDESQGKDEANGLISAG